MRPIHPLALWLAVNLIFGIPVFSTGEAQKQPAADSAGQAKKLSNPISSLISVPFQSNAIRGWAAPPPGEPNNCGPRTVVTPLFPR